MNDVGFLTFNILICIKPVFKAIEMDFVHKLSNSNTPDKNCKQYIRYFFFYLKNRFLMDFLRLMIYVLKIKKRHFCFTSPPPFSILC